MNKEYDDAYPTCDETNATLRIYFEKKDPKYISDYLGLVPTETQLKGTHCLYKGKELDRKVAVNGWFLSSKNSIKSKDSRKHIDFIIHRILPIKEKIFELQKQGARIDISCFWRSLQGHGGPTLSPKQFKNLAELNIDLWYDFYS